MDSIVDFYLPYSDALYGNARFREQILRCPFVNREPELSDYDFFLKALKCYLDEARLTVSLIGDLNYTKDDVLLEIGGGLGLVYGFLKKQGYDIWGIEPCDSGFDGYFTAACEQFKVIGVDGSHFRSLLAKESKELHMQFDVIFSNNVFEHIPELEESLKVLKHILKPDGVMIHNTVNYSIPYEPHFRMLLVPFFPKLTVVFKPSLKQSPLWNGLFFTTTSNVKSMCMANGLHVTFKRDRLMKTFMRLDTDSEFAERQKYFVPLHKFLKYTGLIRMLDKIPVTLTTPITFSITNSVN